MEKRILFLILLFIGVLQVSIQAQNTDEVTLTVSSDGSTKEEAIKNALRSAIEQTYGAFVSSNTEILNNELVKDEVVTISRGNIKKYTEIASETMSNGRSYVTLSATVSISNLVSYAKSKGASAELAGATFAMNLRMQQLNIKNEEIVLQTLLKQLVDILPSVARREIIVKDPKMGRNMKDDFRTFLYDKDIQKYVQLDFVVINDFSAVARLIHNTLTSIALSEMQAYEYITNGFELGELQMYFPKESLNDNKETSTDTKKKNGVRSSDHNTIYTTQAIVFLLRSGNTAKNFALALDSILNIESLNYYIVDNTGAKSEFLTRRGLFKNSTLGEIICPEESGGIYRGKNFFNSDEQEIISDRGSGGGSIFYFQQYDQSLFINSSYSKKYKDKYRAKKCIYPYGTNDFGVRSNQYVRGSSYNGFRRIARFSVLMPISEISKYSSFKIERKDNSIKNLSLKISYSRFE